MSFLYSSTAVAVKVEVKCSMLFPGAVVKVSGLVSPETTQSASHDRLNLWECGNGESSVSIVCSDPCTRSRQDHPPVGKLFKDLKFLMHPVMFMVAYDYRTSLLSTQSIWVALP